MILERLKKEKMACVGCGLCEKRCPEKLIKMVVNEEGFCVPEIAADKCTECAVCEIVCPQIEYSNDNSQRPECYAAIAMETIRSKSTAGGAFGVMGRNILAAGGYVCGVMLKDRKAVYAMVSEKEELEKLQGAKYIEAETGDIFEQVEEKLKEEKTVLFCGTPCHVEALYRYLEKTYLNLITMDFVCHGVSSPKIFGMELEQSVSTENVVGFDFACKDFGFRPDIAQVVLNDGSKSINKEFLELHNQCISLREACYNCHFARLPRVADITLGIFYGIEQIEREMNDGKGVSMILANNAKGRKFVSAIQLEFKDLKKIPLKYAIDNNRFFETYWKDGRRERFFALIKKYGYEKAKKYVKNNKYDIAAITNWSTCNYGAHLTHYALYTVLEGMGLQVLMVEKPNVEPWRPLETPVLFRKNPYAPYALSPLFNSYEDLRRLNQMCDAFVVGSDQVWNYNLFGHAIDFYNLSFVADEKVKISYASSFGSNRFLGNEDVKKRFAKSLERFDYVSVREDTGVDICKNELKIKAKHVLDPVFLADKEIYDKLIKKAKAKIRSNYIFVYIIWPDAMVEKMLEDFGEAHNMELVCVKDALLINNVNKEKWSLPTITNAYVEDWLYYLKHSKYVFADSFHALCFSIIYKKNFVTLINPEIDGSCRMLSLLKQLGLEDRVVTDVAECYDSKNKIKENFAKPIDYEIVYEKLNDLKEESLKWLKEALETTLEKAENNDNSEEE